MQIRYRPEIDGLRTIAVLAVIIYHAQFMLGGEHFLKGGFLGVDVFFVISGFLITSIIMKELNTEGTFSFLGFYERRARRILPALFLVILVALPLAWYLLLPTQMTDFGKSILSTLLFGSNFYWFDSLQEYGAESALLKPFLHTWSLAVEEQYYILFPVLLMVIYKWFKSYTVVLLTAGLLLSLGLSDYVTGKNQSLSFYMLHTRFWELLAGSLLANILYFHPQKENDAFLNKTMPILGLYLIGYSLFFIDLDSNHPGYVTLLPVIGTVLIIWFANEKDLVTQLLSSRLFVGIGLISYSLYLWHYPIFAFGRIIEPSPDWLHKTAWLFLTVIFSVAAYFWVEKPFRNRNRLSLRAFSTIIGVTALLIASFSIFLMSEHDSVPKNDRLKALYGENVIDNQLLKRKSWDILDKIHYELGYETERKGNAVTAPRSESEKLWFTSKAKLKVLIVGNSHGKDLFNAFTTNAEQFPGIEFARYGIHTKSSKEAIKTMKAAPNFKAADVIIISTRFGKLDKADRANHVSIKKLPGFIDTLKESGKKVILTSNTPEFFAYKGYDNIFDGYMREKGSLFDKEELNTLYYSMKASDVDEVNNKLREIAQNKNITYLDKHSIICSDIKMQCDGVTDDGLKTFYDYGHYTLEGAKYFGSKIAEQGWLKKLSE